MLIVNGVSWSDDSAAEPHCPRGHGLDRVPERCVVRALELLLRCTDR